MMRRVCIIGMGMGMGVGALRLCFGEIAANTSDQPKPLCLMPLEVRCHVPIHRRSVLRGSNASLAAVQLLICLPVLLFLPASVGRSRHALAGVPVQAVQLPQLLVLERQQVTAVFAVLAAVFMAISMLIDIDIDIDIAGASGRVDIGVAVAIGASCLLGSVVQLQLEEHSALLLVVQAFDALHANTAGCCGRGGPVAWKSVLSVARAAGCTSTTVAASGSGC